MATTSPELPRDNLVVRFDHTGNHSDSKVPLWEALEVGALKARLEERVGEVLDLSATAVAISRIPYARPSELTAAGVVAEWCGTCSTKHLLFAEVVRAEWPELEPRLWHRPYRVTRELARARRGDEVASAVPPDGLVDVHTFATVSIDGRSVCVDVTFPLETWDGVSDLEPACGEGADHPAGEDPLASKARLVGELCDPVARERFIAALSW